MKNDPLFSVILLSYQSESSLPKIWEYYKTGLEKEKIRFEFLIMDDGSSDGSYQLGLEMEKQDERIKAYQLSKNFTSPYSQFAGLKICKGDCAMFVSDDFQRPVENLVLSFRQWEEGHKIVISGRTSRDDGWLSDFFSKNYYRFMDQLSDVNFPAGGTDGFLADREIIDIINTHISPINTTPIIEVLKLGFQPKILFFDRPKSDKKSRWTLSKKIQLAKNTFFASTSFPIRFITWLGFLIFMFSMILIVGLVIGKIFSSNTLFGFPIQGWASTMILVSFFNGLTLFCLGIVAEYIYRIFEEVKGRPAYIIKEKPSDKEE